MTPLEQKVLELEKKLDDIRLGRDVTFLAELQRSLTSGTIVIEDDASATGTTITVRNSTDDGSETVANEYTGVLTIYSNGEQIGRIGYY